jgi:hypothetical protein
MRHVSAIVIIVILVVMQSCKFFKGRGIFGKKADISEVLQIRRDSIRVADSIRNVQNRLMVIENAKLDSAMNAEKEQLSRRSKYKYNIIVGSFITPEYAKGLAEVYRKQGYDAQIIKMEGSRFELVSAEAHQNFSKAVTRLNQFQDTTEIDAWMFIQK